MNKIISSKIVALSFGILAITFLAAFYVVAWQEPSQTPPEGNVVAPLNVGPTGQEKSGGLILNTGGAETGLIIDQGKLCLGESCISEWTEAGTGGAIVTYRMEATSYQVDDEYFSETVSYDCPEGSSVVNISCSENMVNTRQSVNCTEDPCPDYVQTNSCSCSRDDNKAILQANVVKYGGYCGDCTYGWTCKGYWVTGYCEPSRTYNRWGQCSYEYDCYLPSGDPQCTMEFQCGIKQTVGE